MTDNSLSVQTRIDASGLRACCVAADLGFATTADLEPLPEMIGQERALEAIDFAASMRHRRFNLFAYGPEGTGRHSAVLRMLHEAAAKRPVPCDWVYVHNFDAPDHPRAVSLPQGMGPKLRAAMEMLVDDLASDIPALFESDDYRSRRGAIEQDFAGRQERAFAALDEKARQNGVAILRSQKGLALAPLVDGEVLSPDAIAKLGDDERNALQAQVTSIQHELEQFLAQMPRIEKEHRAHVGRLHSELAEKAVDAALSEMIDDIGEIAALAHYFKALRADLVENAELFLHAGKRENDSAFPVSTQRVHADPPFRRYAVNVMVSNPQDAKGAPVVFETLPTLGNLTGRIEHVQTMGTLVTDFTLIKPGALHRANGGYLVLDARRVLGEPLAWDALKRCLETEAAHIITAAERLSAFATTSIEPDPIPLDLRVVLVGDRGLHLLLEQYDPDFSELFRVVAEFGGDMVRDAETMGLFARLVARVASTENLRPVTADGAAALIEAASREAGDQRKLSLRVSVLWDILREADHLAGRAGLATVSATQIEAAERAAERRADRIRMRMQEMIARDTILIATSGGAVGQVNGLSVTSIGAQHFGWPARITARVRMGAGQVVDIEREVKLGGAIHSKGVLILSGYLATHYAPDIPLSLWASLVFEQSYGGVDGDSASVAELCALISALADVPLDQGFAVTGSINQMGEIQPVGGVNEKIEGFFDACKAQGLTGGQGVLIPRRNAENLMLRRDVVAAVAAGQFHIHAASHVDEALALLTGQPVGARGANGQFPPRSVNARAEARLRDFARARRDFGRADLAAVARPDGAGPPE
ncbi:MAG: AAA family ATPase [Paracoccaceae bacterium]